MRHSEDIQDVAILGGDSVDFAWIPISCGHLGEVTKAVRICASIISSSANQEQRVSCNDEKTNFFHNIIIRFP